MIRRSISSRVRMGRRLVILYGFNRHQIRILVKVLYDQPSTITGPYHYVAGPLVFRIGVNSFNLYVSIGAHIDSGLLIDIAALVLQNGPASR